MRIAKLILFTALIIAINTCRSDKHQADENASSSGEAGDSESLEYMIKLDVVIKHWDGKYNWTQPRVGVVPATEGRHDPILIFTMQKWFVEKSDYYSGLYVVRSNDMGITWTKPEERPELGWRFKGDSIIVGICDFVPGWHQPTGKLIALGHTVYYLKDGQLLQNRPRATAYSVYDPKSDTWTAWDELEMPDNDKFYNSGSGCAQWLVNSDGTLLIPAYFKGKGDTTNCSTSTVLHCRFDGEKLIYIEHGDELNLDVPRGYDEPSITFYKNKYYLTLRNDIKGYMSVGEDGLHWLPPIPWKFEDGSELGSYNTQQHWVTHREGLFLAYTRRGANNDYIPRNRAPLFMAQVDVDQLCVLRKSERILVPERGAMLGNFGVTKINEQETWVTVGENMFKSKDKDRLADGSVFAARIIWSKPNF